MAKAERWYALTTRPRAEDAACVRAEHFGFKTYVPMREKMVLKNRRTKRREPKSFPILPGVVFIGADREITPALLWAMVEPVRAKLPLGYGNCPKHVDRAVWASLALSGRNRKLSPITGIIGVGDQPGLISDDEVRRMVRRNGDEEMFALRMMRGEIDLFERDTVVRILEGPFEGFAGLVKEARGERAKVMTQVFGRETLVELSIEHIEAA